MKATLLIPVEHQVRELDAKLLLACVAARRGYVSLIGPRREMHFRIPSFRKGIYLSKSMTSGSRNVFRMLRKLGHQIVVWDEEALVHLPPEAYYKRRLHPISMQHVSRMFAWGEDNAQLWRRYPEFQIGTSVHISGNPRGDLLRPEIRVYYEDDARTIRDNYGDFILINTNFNQVNAFYSDMNILKSDGSSGEKTELSRRAKGMGMNCEYAEGLYKYKQKIFEDFQDLIPALEQDFPACTIVIRPHPSENPRVYHRIAEACRRVRVTNEGNVVPWLIAAKALIHNGCTTGVEAYALDVAAISYRATVSEQYDRDFHYLPNQLSHQCFTYEELRDTLAKILAGELGAADGDERKSLIDHHLAARTGRLACERIVDVLDDIANGQGEWQQPSIRHQVQGWLWAAKRRIKKRFRGYLPDLSHNRSEYLRYIYPEISMEEFRGRVKRFQEVLGIRSDLKIKKIHNRFFQLSS
jgi:surface carbohydrate biosynthesis protein